MIVGNGAIVDIRARQARTQRNPDMEEASAKLLICTLKMGMHPPGTMLWRSAKAGRDWWLDKVRRLNPGGAEIIPFPRRQPR